MREELARRLCDAFNNEADRTRETYMTTPEEDRDRLGLWKAVADECIRQMEWIRTKNITVMAQRSEIFDGGNYPCPICGSNPTAPITLAPPDWHP